MAKKEKTLKKNWILSEAQNNFIRTNYIKTKIDKAQQNNKCRLYVDKDKMINRKVSKCSN